MLTQKSGMKEEGGKVSKDCSREEEEEKVLGLLPIGPTMLQKLDWRGRRGEFWVRERGGRG